jgi:hypothetical protein
MEIVNRQVFKELLWAALFRPVRGLDCRIADLYPEEVKGHSSLAKGVMATLMTIVSAIHCYSGL